MIDRADYFPITLKSSHSAERCWPNRS